MTVYFALAPESGRLKIGVARNPAARFASLCSSSPEPLKLLAILEGDETLERELHARFSEYRTHREWFRYEGKLRAFVSPLEPPQKLPNRKPKIAERIAALGSGDALQLKRYAHAGRSRKALLACIQSVHARGAMLIGPDGVKSGPPDGAFFFSNALDEIEG
ncbi:MAG: GIY-YIG nuclease family protein [Patescibacteria group bacterium]|nr:GIY-YIG nuclease family protein [Patescibacteria group bacterium]